MRTKDQGAIILIENHYCAKKIMPRGQLIILINAELIYLLWLGLFLCIGQYSPNAADCFVH